MGLLNVFDELPDDEIPVSFYVKCPKIDKEISVSDCEQCKYYKGFIKSNKPYRVVCLLLKKQKEYKRELNED